MPQKILVITYYWPPSGGSGVQRWLKFVKYLPGLGWSPVVFTPENPSFSIRDESLAKDIPSGITVVRRPIWEPYDWFQNITRLFGKKEVKHTDFISTGKKSGFHALATWVRGNYFIPDARVFWVRPSVKFLEGYIKSQGIQTVITTGPPHSMHLIALRLKKKIPTLKWIVDFRDPWSEWDLLDTLMLTAGSKRKHLELEREVLTTADRVITIAPYHVARLEALSGRKVDLITNGFDEDDFKGIKKTRTSQFTVRHIGVVDELRDPRPFMEVLGELCMEDPEFATSVRVEFIGQVNSSFRGYVESTQAIAAVTTFVNPVPHATLLELYGTTDLQLLVLAHTAIAPGNLPGKFFEYLASGNPILALGPVIGDAAEVLSKTGAGEIFERSDLAGIKSALMNYYRQWKRGVEPPGRNIEAYTRRKLAEQLDRVMRS